MRDSGGPRFTVGGVIQTGLSIVLANLLRFLGIILVVGAPVVLLIGGGAMVMMANGAAATQTGTGVTFNHPSALQVLFFICAIFLALLAYFLIQASITYGTLQQLRGRPAGVGACVSNGLNALPRVLVASLVLFVVIAVAGGVAAMLLSALASAGGGIAGFIAALALAAAILFVVVQIWVFIPAIVVERAGPIDCFSRSIALTKGRRWQIFGIVLLIGVANWVIQFVSQLLSKVAPLAGGVIDLAAGLFFLALGSALAAVGYYYLRAEKEGVAIDDIATVFD